MNHQIIGRKIIELDTVDSTNNYSLSLLEQGKIDEGTVIFARSQSAGQGLNGNSWESEKNKNIIISIIIYPEFLPLTHHFMLNIFSSLAIHDFINNKIPGQRTFIKWPNDVYIDQKKVAGILIKNAIRGDGFQYSIIGLGININQLEFKSAAPNPVSLRKLTHIRYDLKESLDELCKILDQRYKELKNRNFKKLTDDYHKNLLFINVLRNYLINDKLVKGKILGIAVDGKLVLEIEGGKLLYCDMKEIAYILD